MADTDFVANEQSQIRIPAEDAFRELLPEMDALSDAELVAPTVDIMSAVAVVLGVLPRLQALRPQIEKELATFDLARFDRLELYAKALHHANALYRIANTPKVSIAQRAEELTEIRDRLLTDAQSLANYKLIDPENLKQCKTAVGYKPLAADIAILLTVFKEHWPSIRNRTPVSIEVLNDANDRAEELLEAVALKDQTMVTVSEASERRRRAFVIFERAYRDAQRAVTYLRAEHEDAELVAPSIFVKRPKRRADSEQEADAGAPQPRTGNISVESNGLPITAPLVN
jgi:hypothetical protein